MPRTNRSIANEAVAAYRRCDFDEYTALTGELAKRLDGHPCSIYNRLLVEAGLAEAIAHRMANRYCGRNDDFQAILFGQLMRLSPPHAVQIFTTVFADKAYSADFTRACGLYKLACHYAPHKSVLDAFSARGLMPVMSRCKSHPPYPDHAVIVRKKHLRLVPQVRQPAPVDAN